MIDGLKPYPAMKDSGMPWLGDVPQHWEVTRVGHVGRLLKGVGGTKEDATEAGVPCVRYGDLYTTHQFFIREARSRIAAERARDYTSIGFGDVLFAASGETIEDIGKSAVNLMDGPAYCGGDVVILRPSIPVDPAFMGYALDCRPSAAQKATMARGTTVKHIYPDQLKWLFLCLPPLPEQSAIVRFLDHADRRIRRYIRAKQKLIKLLEEQKQAIVHRAVTRGLDPNIRLKPSGVEWLGDVPEHWRVLPNRAVFTEVKERDHPNADMLSVTITRGVIRQDAFLEGSSKKDSSNQDKSAYKYVRRGDIAYNKMRAWQGAVGVSQYEGIVSPAYVVQRPRDGASALYLHYLLRTPAFAKEAERWSYGITSDMWSLRPEHFKMIYLCLPPLPEQGAIVRFLDEATASLTVATERARREVDLLREYRTRLIADVVTGKLDVRDAAARLPDEADEPEPLDGLEAEGDADEIGADDADEVPEEADA